MAVSGTATWKRYGHSMSVDLTVRAGGVTRHLTGSWDTRAAGATATLSLHRAGGPVELSFPAP